MTTVLPVSAKQKKSTERIAPVLALILLPSIYIKAQETTSAPEPAATELDSVVVTGAVADPLTAPSADTATAELSQVPGGTAVIRAEERQQAAANNVADLLANQPGVQVRDAGGRNEAGILSVRGAGTNNGGPFGNTTKGVSIFVNGLPVTSPGAYAFEAPDALATDYVEVLRGASALTYGSLSLGGGINYVYHTGHNSSPGLVRFDIGSFGYYREQASSGFAWGPLDYYFSITNLQQDGFRDNSQGEAQRYHLNLGYQINPNLENRFYFSYIVSRYHNPRVLTQEQMYENPQQVSPELGTGLRGGLIRDAPGTYIFQNRTALTLDEASSLELNLQFMHFPTETLGSRIAPLPRSSVTVNNNGKLAGSLIYQRQDILFERRSDTKISLAVAHLLYASTEILGDSYNPNPGILLQKYRTGGTDSVLSLSNDVDLLGNEKLWLSTAIALSYKERNGKAVYPFEDSAANTYTNYAPQLGLRYNVTPDIQVFGNVSRLAEAPSAQTLAPDTTPPFTITDIDRNLREQTALSAEIGVRGRVGIFEGGITLYYQSLRNEILTVATVDSSGETTTATNNASPTIHQGIEFDLKTTLWESKTTVPENPFSADDQGKQVADGEQTTVSGPESEPKPSRLLLNASYTWADNHYKGDPLLEKNELPGLAPHYYSAELLFQHSSGFFAAVNVTGIITKFPIDYSNSRDFYAKPYTLLGARTGYASSKKGWEVYLDIRNITDETYASVINPIYDAQAVANRPASLAAFWPGDGFNITGGFTYRF